MHTATMIIRVVVKFNTKMSQNVVLKDENSSIKKHLNMKDCIEFVGAEGAR